MTFSYSDLYGGKQKLGKEAKIIPVKLGNEKVFRSIL